MARDEEGKVIFDEEEQKELDRIVQERVARVKSTVPEDYEDLKSLSEELGELGYSGTVAEKKAALKAYREEIATQNELQRLQDEADDRGTSPELLREIREAKKAAEEARAELSALKEEEAKKKSDEEEQKRIEEAVSKMYADFSEKHPDVDVQELENNAKFVKFAKKRTGTLIEIYEDYVDLMGEAEVELFERVRDKSNRSTGGGGTKDTNGGNYGLSPEQMKLLAEYNRGKTGRQIMTPKEFKEML